MHFTCDGFVIRRAGRIVATKLNGSITVEFLQPPNLLKFQEPSVVDFDLQSGRIAKSGSHITSNVPVRCMFDPPKPGQAVMVWDGQWHEGRIAERYKPSQGALRVLIGKRGVLSVTAGRIKRIPHETQNIDRDWVVSCKFLDGNHEEFNVCKEDTVVC